MFKVGQKVDVTGDLAGQGIRRRHQAPPFLVQPRQPRQLAVAQQARLHRQAQDPGRVFPGKRMAGHLGDVQAHRAEPGDRAHRRRAPVAAGQGLDSGQPRPGHHRAPTTRPRAPAGLRASRREAVPGAKPSKPATKPAAGPSPRRRRKPHPLPRPREVRDGTETHQRPGQERGDALPHRTRCSAANTTSRWCIRS